MCKPYPPVIVTVALPDAPVKLYTIPSSKRIPEPGT